MTATPKPATPLPWTLKKITSQWKENPYWHAVSLYAGERLIAHIDLTNGPSNVEGRQAGNDGAVNAEFVATACNAYPRLLTQRNELVAALKHMVANPRPSGRHALSASFTKRSLEAEHRAVELLARIEGEKSAT